MNCTRCQEAGFLNLHQIPVDDLLELEAAPDFTTATLQWIKVNDGTDVQVCDCCGDGQAHYGEPGQHTVTGKHMTSLGWTAVWDCGRVPECI